MANIVLSSNSRILLKSLYVTASLVQSQGTYTHTYTVRIVVWYYNEQYHPQAKSQPITRPLTSHYQCTTTRVVTRRTKDGVR